MLATGSGAAGSGTASPAGEAIGASQAGLPDGRRGERPSIAAKESADRHARATEPTASGPMPSPPPIAASGPGRATAEPPTAARPLAAPRSGLLALWALGAAAFGAWVLAGAWSTRRLARAATAVASPEWLDALREVRQDLGIRRPVRLLRSDHAVMPMTWGWRRPVVLVPAAALGWSSERRSVVLRHELAHVTRGDAVTRLLARWTCAVYWFNPMVWFAAYRLRVEGERACDDAVLRLGTLASEYAGHLLGIARDHNALRLRAAAAVAMARRSQLEGRLRAILAPDIRRVTHRSTAVLASAVLAGTALAVSAVAPAAQNRAPPPAPVPPSGQTPDAAPETGTEPAGADVESTLEVRVPAGGFQLRADRVEVRLPDRPGAVRRRLVQLLGEGGVELRLPDRPGAEPGDTALEFRGSVVVAREALDLRLGHERDGNVAGAGRSTGGHAAMIESERNRDAGMRGGRDTAAVSAPASPQPPTVDDGEAQLRRAAEESRAQALASQEATRARAVPEHQDQVFLVELVGGGVRLRAVLQPPTLDEDEGVAEPRMLESLRAEGLRGGVSVRGVLESASETRNRIEAVRQARRQARREIDPRLADTFIGALGDPDAEVRERAARALGRHRVPEGAEALRAALRDDDPAVREGAAWALGRIGGGGAVGALLGALGDPEPEVRAGAASALGMLRSPAAVDGLAAALDDPDVRVRDRTARALGRTRDRIATGAVDAVASATLEVIEGFRRTGGDLALEALIRLMDVSDPELRRAAIAALSGGRWFSPGDTAETPQPPAPGVTGPAR